jgi:hypothetical protein
VHAEGVAELSPGWSVAEPWVFKLIIRTALKERKRPTLRLKRIVVALETRSEFL